MEDLTTFVDVLAAENTEFQIKVKEVDAGAEHSQNPAEHKRITEDLKAELRKLQNAYEAVCSEKGKKVSEINAEKDFLRYQLKTLERENADLPSRMLKVVSDGEFQPGDIDSLCNDMQEQLECFRLAMRAKVTELERERKALADALAKVQEAEAAATRLWEETCSKASKIREEAEVKAKEVMDAAEAKAKEVEERTKAMASREEAAAALHEELEGKARDHDAARLLLDNDRAVLEAEKSKLQETVRESKRSLEKDLADARAKLAEAEETWNRASSEVATLTEQKEAAIKSLDSAHSAAKAGRARRLKMYKAFGVHAIEAISRTGGETLVLPPATEDDVDTLFPTFLAQVLEEVRKVPRRLNLAVENECKDALRAAGVNLFFNLNHLCPDLDFGAVVKVSDVVKTTLPPRVLRAVEALVKSCSRKPVNPSTTGPSAKGKQVQGRGPAPSKATPVKGAAPPKPQ